MAAVIFFGAVSCAKEDISSSLAGGEVEVTFTANLPELGTRAYGEAEQVNTLRYYVYDNNGTLLEGLSNTTTGVNIEVGKTTTVNLVLIKGMTYNILFWADSNNGYYSIENGVVSLTGIDNINANDESRDAFYAAVKGFNPADANADTTIELYRPFAQLNAKVTNMAEVNKSITVTSTTISTKIYTTFNPFAENENEVVGGLTAESVTFNATRMTDEDLAAGHLSMNYLLAPAGGCVADIAFTFNNDKEVPISGTTYRNVPLKANYRTNIIGKLLTQAADFEVEIRPAFGVPNDNRVFNIIDLQAALDAAPENETTVINLGANIVGNVTDVQKPGRKVVIDGCGCKYNGTIKVHSNSNHYADAALTIKNLNFETSTASVNCIEALENGAQRYSCNITVEDCTFTATGDAVNTAVGVQIKSSKYAKVIGCTATNMHSLIQAQSCDESVLVQGCTVNGKNGVAFKQVKSATVEGSTITAAEYGIRFDGNTDNYGITVKDNTVTANQPFIVRKMTGKDNTIALEGTNTLTVSAASISTETPAYQIVITNGSDDEAYVKPTGTYTLTGADNYLVYPRDIYFFVATWDEFTAALAANEPKIKLTDNIEYSANYQLQKDVVIDLNGKSMTLPMINIHKNVTIKNGTINGKVYARKNSEIVFNNVKFSGAVADDLSTEGHLAIQGGCKSLYAKDCLFSPTSVSGSQTKPLSFEGGSTIMKFENCEFKSSPYKKQVYFNSLSATGSLDFTNCNFNNKTPNIMFAAACPLTNLTMSGTTKLSSVTLETNRAKDAVTAEDLAYLRESLIANNSMSSVRLFYAGGSSEYIR